MMAWKSFGASVTGPAHIAEGKPNQDAWLAFHYIWGDGIVVSDGLGSKQYSDFGSRAACLAVARTVHDFQEKDVLDHTFISDRIINKWLSLIMPLDACDCAATCLFAFRVNDAMIRVGMLGDGLAAVVKTDGSVVTLSDGKSEGFSNITTALSADVTVDNWLWLSVPDVDCQSIVLCTDGVADDLYDVNGFVKEFAKANRKLSSASAARRTRKALENWPTPKHIDDKTIACLFQAEVVDE